MNIKKIFKKYQFAIIIVFMVIIAFLILQFAKHYKSKTYNWGEEYNNNYQSGLDYLEKTEEEQKQQFDKNNLKTLDSNNASKINISE